MRLQLSLLVAATSLTITVGSAAGEPVLLDTIGVYETEVAAEVQPNAKPARDSAVTRMRRSWLARNAKDVWATVDARL